MKKIALGLLVFWFIITTLVTLSTWVFAQDTAPYPAFSGAATTFYWSDKQGRQWECVLRQTTYHYSKSPYPFTYWWCNGRGIPTPTPYPTNQYYPYSSGDYP